MLVYAIIFITLALALYSVGVWGEKLRGELKAWHLCMFWAGFVCDTTGTTLMTGIAGDGFVFNFHGVTGVLAIVLMLVHAVWATVVLVRNNPIQKKSFHRFSIVVWCIWLIPFLSGAVFAMAR